MASVMKEFEGSSYLFRANAPFIEALYDRYLEDPGSVEPRWRAYFDALQRLVPKSHSPKAILLKLSLVN